MSRIHVGVLGNKNHHEHHDVNFRLGPSYSSKRYLHLVSITNDLLYADSKPKQVKTISRAFQEFDHYNVNLHNEEIQAGAVEAIYHLLFKCINENNGDDIPDFELISDLCSLLSCVFRCSNNEKLTSFYMIGEDLVRVFIQVIQSCLFYSSIVGPIYYKPLKVLHSLSQLPLIAQHFATNDDLLSSLIASLHCDGINAYYYAELNYMQSSAKLEALAILRNVTYYATNEIRYAIASDALVLPNLLQLVYIYGHDPLTYSLVAEIIYHLASSPRPCIHLVSQGMVLNTLIHLLLSASNTTFTDAEVDLISDDSRFAKIMTKHYVLTTILLFTSPGNIFTSPHMNRLSCLLLHCDGLLLDTLTSLLEEQIREPSANEHEVQTIIKVIRSLITRETAHIMMENNDLLTLLESMCYNDTILHSVRNDAIETLVLFTNSSHQPHALKILVALFLRFAESKIELCMDAAARVFLKMTLVSSNHNVLINTERLPPSLAFIATCTYLTQSTKENATGALFNLSCCTESHDREKIILSYQPTTYNSNARTNHKSGCNFVLQSLVHIANSVQANDRIARDFAVGTLVQLSKLSKSVQMVLVRCEGLLDSLIQYVSDTSVQDSCGKETVRRSIFQLTSVM